MNRSLLDRKSTNVRSFSWQLSFIRAGMKVLSNVQPKLAAAWAKRIFLTPRRVQRPQWERQLLRSAKPFFAHSGKEPLSAWYWGEGPVILLVHGWAGRGTQLGRFVEPLVNKGFRVVAYDGPAHGRSRARQTDVRQLTEALETVGRRVGAIHGLLAHSMGGVLSTRAMHQGLETHRAVFMGAPADPFELSQRFSALLGLSPEVLRQMQQKIEQRVGLGWEEFGVLPLAQQMTTPLLLIHDEHDREVPFSHGERIRQAWPDAGFLPTSGLGHSRLLQDPAVIDEAVRFLAG